MADRQQAQADEDAISRQAVLDLLEDTNNGWIINEVLQLPSVKPQEPYDFAKWVATEIFAEWEYNKDAFAEIACRKLARLGIVRAKGDEWDLPSVTPQQEDIAKDGTLTVKVADGRKVTRVLVCGDNHFGGLYYPDEDAEPKTGHWVEEKINEWSRKVFCSECGCPPPFEYVSTGDVYSASGYGVSNKTKFCPNCGAKMD